MLPTKLSFSKKSLITKTSETKESTFREFVQRQVNDARISFIESNFGSTHRGSSFIQPQASPEKEDSLVVTFSGTIIQQTKEIRTGSIGLYDKNNEKQDDEESSEDESEIDSEEREVLDGEETLSGDKEKKSVRKGKRKVNEEEKNNGEEREVDGGESLSGDEEEKSVKKGKRKVNEEEENDGKGREGDGGESLSGDEEEKTVERRKSKVTEREENDGEEGEGDGERELKDKEVESGEEKMEKVEEKIGDEKETQENNKEKAVEEGERTSEVEEKSSNKEEDVGDVENIVVEVEEKAGGEEKKSGEEEKEKSEEMKEEEEGGPGKEQETQEIEQGDDEQVVGIKKEDKGQDQEEIKEVQIITESSEVDEKSEEEEGEDEEGEDEEGEDEEKESISISQMGEDGQEIITKAVQSKDDMVSFELGSNIGKCSITSSFEHEKLTERLKQINYELSYVNRKNRFLTKAVLEIRGKNKADVDTGESKLTEGYLKKLVNFEKIKFSIQNEMRKYTDQVDVLRERSKISAEIYEAAQEEFLKKIDDAYKKLDSNFGSLASEKTIVQPTPRIQTALANVSNMRLKMVKLQNHLAEKEAQLKSLDDRGGGLHLIDYEKLKMHNQHLIETIAERDLELLRLRKKIETDTQKLAHVRERAKIIGEENRDYHSTLEQLDAQIKLAREDVNKKKQRRQRITVETRKMRQDAGLLTKPKLVTSFRQTELDLEAAKNKFNDIMLVHQQQKTKIADLKERLNSTTEFTKIIKN
ncbi:hypothetical protein LSTR_LSTR003177 [Laodelphax striatellus]|uniref:CCDC113/CCDC96 coiled-coil domain-containing protein n=1 Tax=Laodelphax striatellus TaxID=195883 RepID=A0A482XTJ4_LAOST|nr:hypothetical protein LSTR_LSTR003177 [Laodelphax striatellus]